MAMELTLFKGDFPIETPISSGFPIARFDYRRVTNHDVGLLWTHHVTFRDQP